MAGSFGIIFTGFIVAFIAIAVIIVATAVKGIGTWNKNNHAPRLTVSATVVSKRQDVSHHRQGNAGDISGAHGYHTVSSTRYYVTFQVASGDRIEFAVSGSEYGMLVEGDAGDLSFQGTRYLSFERMM